MKRAKLDATLLREAKRLGFSDARIASAKDKKESEIRAMRKRMNIVPVDQADRHACR